MSSSNKMPGRKASAAVFIAVFPPFFFILLIAMLIPEIFPITVRILPLYFLMLFLLALFQTAAADVLFRDYSRMTVAEPVLPLIIGALAVILFRTGSLPERFIPGWDMLLPLTGVFTQVILTSILYHNLREYAVSIIDHERMAGTPLKDETRRNVDLYLGIRDLKRMKTTLVLLTIGIVIVLIIAMGRRVQSSWAHYAIIGLYSFSLLVSFSWLNTALENMFRRTENIIIPETMTRRRTAIAIIIILICLVSAFVFSGDTPVLSPAFIKEALSQIDISMPAFDMKLPDMHVDELLPPESMVRGGSPDIDLGWISVAIKIIIFILLGFAALLVIIMAATSLLSPAKASVAVRGNPFLLFFSRILLLVRAVADMMKGLFGLFVRRDYQRAKRDTSIDDTMVFSGIVDKRATRAKQRETNRVIAAFVKVIRWGKGHDVPFTRNLAPQEYLNRIERRYPLLAPSLTLIGTTFEEAIFSLNLIGETKMASYYLAAKNVLRYREKK